MERHLWTKEEDEILLKYYPNPETTAQEIADILGRTRTQVHSRAARLGIKKPEIYRSIAGKKGTQSEAARAHRFPKGHIPANKGKKMDSETYKRCSGTMFKKGNTPINHRDVGSERVNVDGYIEIKVAEPNKWRLKHRVIWEQNYGKIPAGCNIQFKNGNSQDVRLENLYIITRQEQLKTQNSLIARYPKELVEIIRYRGTLKRQITMYNKKEK